MTDAALGGLNSSTVKVVSHAEKGLMLADQNNYSSCYSRCGEITPLEITPPGDITPLEILPRDYSPSLIASEYVLVPNFQKSFQKLITCLQVVRVRTRHRGLVRVISAC